MRKGFTLVELSIVLIIIGLIIGGVMKGKDLINSAEQKKIYNTWIKGWEIAVNSYQDKTGAMLGDGLNINGGTAAAENGVPDDIDLSTTTAVQVRLRAVGLDVPVGNIVATDGGSYNIKGKYATGTAIAYLYNLASATDGGSKPRLYITTVPTDVAIAFDRLTDGALNSATGAFRQYPDNTSATGAWPDAKITTTVNVSLEL
ncbi:MAG: prepilin-type N-terminal cleavage/methylation domain-containing protein [Sulfurimonas sp.]|nr:prepilin-type N-terminal cleavage/methylation domain-containing protein [Sulfurimonas sp.]